MHTNFEHLVALNAQAVQLSVDQVSAVTPADLARPTPCGSWTVADLLAHLIAQHRGFAAAAAGVGDHLAHWEVRALEEDYVAAYRREADRVLAAFAAVDPAGPPFAMAEFGEGQTFAAATAIGFHTLDYLVHAWDVAVALGRPFSPDATLVDAVLTDALAIPDGAFRADPGSPFAPALAVPPGATAMEQILLLLGRSPDWPAGTAS
jgi:uncharacterized protein (TIGR03086 family)